MRAEWVTFALPELLNHSMLYGKCKGRVSKPSLRIKSELTKLLQLPVSIMVRTHRSWTTRNMWNKYSLERGRWHHRFGSGPSSRSCMDHAVWPRKGVAPPILGQIGRVSSRALGPSRACPLLVSQNPRTTLPLHKLSSRRRFRRGFCLEFSVVEQSSCETPTFVC
jgi:hypothetical protein